jgi:hypothetical protein
MKGLGRNLRALFVAFHLAAVSVAALPAPVGSGDRRAWKNPTVQVEIAAWARRLHLKPARLEERLFRLSGAWMKARERLLAPFQPYLDLTGCEQPWRMFVAAERFPTRLSIQAHTEDTGPSAWETVFEERSDKHAWRRDFFDHDRVRGALLYYGWPAHQADYERACTYFARAIFGEREHVDRVRCRLRRQRSPSPGEALAGTSAEITWELPYLVDRGKLAP